MGINSVFSTAASLLQQNQLQLSKSYQHLASGLKINQASDNPAGYVMSQVLQGQMNGAYQAQQNVQDASSSLSIAGGALSGITDNLQQIRDLAVQAANGTLNQTQRDAIGQQINQLSVGIDQMAQGTQFNGQSLLNGTGSFTVQSGPNASDTQNVTLGNAQTDAAAGGIGLFDSAGGSTTFANGAALTAGGLTQATAQSFISDVDKALARVSNIQANVGVTQNSLDNTANNLGVYSENIAASQSQIQSVDMASESANMVQLQIQAQAMVSLLAQSNKLSKNLSKTLFGG